MRAVGRPGRSQTDIEMSSSDTGQAMALMIEPARDAPTDDWNRLKVSPAALTAHAVASRSHWGLGLPGRIAVPPTTSASSSTSPIG